MNAIQVSELIALFKQGREHTLQIAAGVPETHRMKQLAPGKATPTWLIGHLARTVDRLALEWTLQEAPVLPEAIAPHFAPEHAGGITPTANPDDYPPWDTLVAAYTESTDLAFAGFAHFNDADLVNPVPGPMPDDYRVRFPDIGTLLRLLPNHDAYHRGQMGLLAKLD